MFSIKAGKITTPMVKTSIDGGLGVDDYAEICTFKIISVSESAPPVIKEQAKYFKNKVKDVIRTYIEYFKENLNGDYTSYVY